jgi:tRNA A22 N-methylase
MLALALRERGRAVIATERTPMAMDVLRADLLRRGGALECRQGEGFEAVRPGEVDVAVVAGMGGKRIIQILESASWLPRWLVLQAVQDQDILAGWIRATGWPCSMLVATDRGRSYETWRVAAA